MKISKVEIENFKSYYGLNSLEISSSPKKNITILLGMNNSGKTSLMEAVRWCLYNEPPEKGERGSFVNHEKVTDLRNAGEFRVSVTITFEDNKQVYRAIRKADIRSAADAKDPDSSLYIAKVSASGSSGRIQADDDFGFQKIIDDILPHSISQYFIVDGDRISEFVRPTASQTRVAIENLLKFEHLKRASKDLDKLHSHLLRRLESMTKGSKSSHDIIDQHKNLEEKINADEKKLEELQEDEKRASAMFHTLESKIAEATDSLDKLKRANAAGELNEKSRETLKYQLRDLSKELADGYLKALDPTLRKVWVHLNDSRVKGKIPRAYEDVFIRDLLTPCEEHGTGTCICGTEFNKKSDQYKVLKKLLEDTPPKSLTDQIVPLQLLLVQGQKRGNAVDESIKEYRDTIDALEQEIAKRTVKIETICKEIDQDALQIAESVFNQKRLKEKQLADLKSDIIILEHEIKRDKKALEDISKSIEHDSKIDARTAKLRDRISLVSESKLAVDTVYDEYKIALREKLVKIISEIFLSLITAEENFSRFEIDDDFNYDILNSDGVSWKLHLSNAQRKIFALSFVAGLRLVAEEEAPFILDSPLGVIDVAHRRNYANIVPDLASQLVLLLTDSEATDEFIERINPKVGAYYTIDYDSASNRSKFIKAN